MDWFVILTPLIVLVLLPPVIVFGCGVQDQGELNAATRTLQLNFDVPKTDAGVLSELRVTFDLSAGGSFHDIIPPLSVKLDLNKLADTAITHDHGNFEKGGTVTCTCTVTFVGWASVVPPSPVQGQCSETDDTIVFQLKWDPLVWNESLKDYTDVQFNVLCAN